MAEQEKLALQALDQLQDLVNRVLLETGRIFSESVRQDAEAASYANSRMKLAIPSALNRFHENVDQLENQLSHAKAVMRRDLAVCRAIRLKREAVVAVGEEGIAAHSPTSNGATTREEPGDETKGSQREGVKDEVVKTVDLTPQRLNNSDNAEATEITGEEEQTPIISTVSTRSAEVSPRHSPNPPHVPLQDAKESEPSAAPAKEPTKDPIDSAPERISGTATYQEIDFDSMFSDPTDGATDPNHLTSTNGDLNFALDFSGSNPNGIQNTFANDYTANNTDVSSLLPGLESYANGARDLQMLDVPATQASEDQQQQQLTNGTSTFDELFDYNNFDMGDADGGGSGTQNLDTEFDDAFFNIDES
ncbi:hypothetical protein B0A49_00079 [Cryomyces minteri]|uniref:Uncharacterized protein n=1 Tax=Cryomyces minteri TaxID=331657 RepID=A0A4U0Y1V9_9PEZI|nr:hypothetical protein B0A49_00079 [Cryomyces minteri]